MRSLMVVAILLVAGVVYAIPIADVHITWDSSDGTLGKDNPAWNNVGTSGEEGVRYIGPSSATAPVAVSTGGVKGGYVNISDYGTVGVDSLQTHNYYGTSGIVGSVMSGATAFTCAFWIRDDFVAGDGYPSQYVFRQQGVPGTALKYRGEQNKMQFIWNNESGWLYGDWHTVRSDNNEWIFFAVTVDTVSDTIVMYSGDENNAVYASNTWTGLSLSALPTITDADNSDYSHTMFGYNDNGTDKYAGYDMDEYRIYNQALTASQIEEIRQYDLIPEPATMTLFSLGTLVFLKRRKV